jgi:hypothetical protein
MRKSTFRFWLLIISLAIALHIARPAHAANLTLVPCGESAAFQQRQSSAPEGYYYTKPFEAYSPPRSTGSGGGCSHSHRAISLRRWVYWLVGSILPTGRKAICKSRRKRDFY